MGAAPLTRACLSDPKVSKTLGNSYDSFDEYLLSIQSANDLAMHAFEGGYNGSLLKTKIVQRRQNERLTEPQSQERIDSLAQASTHGAKFLATGGSHLMADDFFIAHRKNEAKKEAVELSKVKKRKVHAMKIHQMAMDIMQKRSNKIELLQFNRLTLLEIETLLRWHDSWSGTISKASKAQKSQKLVEIFHSSQSRPSAEEWTAEEEETLQKLQDTNSIQLSDTAVGRQKAVIKQHVFAAGIDLSNEEWEELMELRRNKLGEGDEWDE